MEIENHFKDYVKLQVEEFDYVGVYQRVVDSTEYNALEIRTMILNCLYNLELNHFETSSTGKYQAIMSFYLGLFSKEKNKCMIVKEHLMYIIFICHKVRKGYVNDSPTSGQPPFGMYS